MAVVAAGAGVAVAATVVDVVAVVVVTAAVATAGAVVAAGAAVVPVVAVVVVMAVVGALGSTTWPEPSVIKPLVTRRVKLASWLESLTTTKVYGPNPLALKEAPNTFAGPFNTKLALPAPRAIVLKLSSPIRRIP